MNRPSFQFYPGDWRGNANLRRCSWAARGVWLEVMCLMHDSEEYGVLRWSLKDLQQALGCPMALLMELVNKRVLKGSDGTVEVFVFTPRHAGKDCDPVTLIQPQNGPLWFSSRMVVDEYKRLHAGAKTRFTATPSQRHGVRHGEQPSQRHGADHGYGASSSSSTSSSKPKVKSNGADAPNRQRADIEKLKDLGVDEQVAKDWLAVRKAKRAPLTETVLAGLQNEASKAGISVAEAVTICARKSWQGFNATWDWREGTVAPDYSVTIANLRD